MHKFPGRQPFVNLELQVERVVGGADLGLQLWGEYGVTVDAGLTLSFLLRRVLAGVSSSCLVQTGRWVMTQPAVRVSPE